MRVRIDKSATGFVATAFSDDRRDKKPYGKVELGHLHADMDRDKFNANIAACLSNGAVNYVNSIGAQRYTSIGED